MPPRKLKTVTPKRTPFAVGPEDGKKLYVEMRYAGFELLVALIDALPLVYFGRSKKPYIAVQDALDWHKNELKYQPNRKGSQHLIEVFTKALQDFAAGNVQEVK